MWRRCHAIIEPSSLLHEDFSFFFSHHVLHAMKNALFEKLHASFWVGMKCTLGHVFLSYYGAMNWGHASFLHLCVMLLRILLAIAVISAAFDLFNMSLYLLVKNSKLDAFLVCGPFDFVR